MSVVTSVILTMSCIEYGFDPEDGPTPNLDRVNALLAEHGKAPLSSLTPHMLTGKHPQTTTFGGGYNYFPQKEFTEFLCSIEWDEPKNVVLVMQTEDEPTRIWRPLSVSEWYDIPTPAPTTGTTIEPVERQVIKGHVS